MHVQSCSRCTLEAYMHFKIDSKKTQFIKRVWDFPQTITLMTVRSCLDGVQRNV